MMIMDLRIGMIIINQETGETTMSEYIIREREDPFHQIVLNQLFAIKCCTCIALARLGLYLEC